MQRSLTVLALTLANSVGCGFDSPESHVAVYKALDDNYDDAECPENVCGMNTNRMKWYFNELDRDHTPNSTKYQFVAFVPPPLPSVTSVDVVKDRLVAFNFGAPLADPTKVLGTKIILRDRENTQWAIEVVAVNQLETYWVPGPAVAPVTYTLKYFNLTDPSPTHTRKQDFCDQEPQVSVPIVRSDAVIFEGERYDPISKKITLQGEASGWFNVACMNTVPGKMFMFRHTTASSDPIAGFTTTLDERQALINMWTANYCGDGRSFTAPGEPLKIRDNRGWIPPTSNWSWPLLAYVGSGLASYEALWNQSGAVCLDTPRLAVSAFSNEAVPDVLQLVKDHCAAVRAASPLVPCTTATKRSVTSWQTRAHLLTANPSGS